jgi:hypothetical protein
MTFERTQLLTLSDIAEIAGVGLSAVSNWTSRWADFPIPMDGLYQPDEVEQWLRQHNKTIRRPARPDVATLLWKSADALRSLVPIEAAPELILQLLALRAASAGAIQRLATVADSWRRIRNDPTVLLGTEFERVVNELRGTDSDIAELFEPSASARSVRLVEMSALYPVLDELPADAEWGKLASDVLTEYVERYGIRGAEQVTPSAVADLMITLLQPMHGLVYDPACGVGVSLARAWRGRGPRLEMELFGQDISAQAERLARLHLLINDAPFRSTLGNSLRDDRLWDLRADRVIADPPLNQRVSYPESFRHDPRWLWGVPTSTADWLWIQHVAFHLADGGIGVVAVAGGTLHRAGADAQIRRQLVQSDLLDIVVQLPAAMLPSTSVPLSLVVLEKGRRDRTGRTLFVDLSKAGSRQRGGLHRFRPDELADVAGLVHQWRNGGDPAKPGVAGVSTTTELLTGDVALTPARYVAYPASLNVESAADRFARLKTSLRHQAGDMASATTALEAELASLEVAE